MQDFPGFHAFPAPAKVNLFLHITGRRPDGYHLLQSVFRLLDFNDTIFIRPTDDGSIRRIHGNDQIPEADDLCIKAARLLQQTTGCSLGAEIGIEKHIPMGGGLGGGSSDAATVLLALNRLWETGLSRIELQNLGVRLGADVPVFIFGQNAWAEGIGDKLQAIRLEPRHYVVLTPAVHVSTAQVFASNELTRNTIPTTIAAFSRGESSGSLFHNDLEPVVGKQYPAVVRCMDWLNQHGKARMSGSGASVFAEFGTQAEAKSVFGIRPAEIAGVKVSGFMASGLEQHPLYSFAG
ncbi:4-diphosphocytidyl-2-C-methyl-D-erythritol kinase [Methylophilaceae bacterium]|nr:4-diphosphocytidyl-2-C-methyl-D-erythritol kinase [Methylophilaceae bacterium]